MSFCLRSQSTQSLIRKTVFLGLSLSLLLSLPIEGPPWSLELFSSFLQRSLADSYFFPTNFNLSFPVYSCPSAYTHKLIFLTLRGTKPLNHIPQSPSSFYPCVPLKLPLQSYPCCPRSEDLFLLLSSEASLYFF